MEKGAASYDSENHLDAAPLSHLIGLFGCLSILITASVVQSVVQGWLKVLIGKGLEVRWED